MHERHSPYGKRAIVEVRIPGKRPGQPARYIAFGRMPTARQNDAVVALPSCTATYCGQLLGEWITRPKRIVRPDKAKGRYLDPVNEIADGLDPDKVKDRLPAYTRVLHEPDEWRLALVREEVRECLATGARLRMRWLVVQREGQLMTIPDKGKVVRWGSLEDLVQALAQGVPF